MKWLFFALSVLLIYLQYQLWLGTGGIHDVQQLKQSIEEQKLHNEKLDKRNKGMYAEVDELKTGLEAVEERARNELGLIKENETFVRIIDEPNE